ncbi:universal stress protein [Rhodococcus pyridinivorans]|uniref:universal stress protein n=1 Tax=Rhodococcus TaxID=1827 RepID=UPI0007EB2A0B|nr:MULTISPECIES: universal stress protein [Rhodococcus]OBA36147.1 universal stress protein [Rhodococcus sp. 852002-51564_SCH6189132-a]UGQ57537.1 universal stress protein [Rhodococcus pyridinivorans]
MKPLGEAPRDHNHVTVGADGSPASERAVRWAAATAAGRKIPLHLVHAVDFAPSGWTKLPFFRPSQVFEWSEAEAQALLKEAAETAEAVAPNLEITAELALTGSAKWLVELSRTSRMIVLGATGSTKMGEAFLGSTPVSVAGHAECPVVVVRGPEGPVPDERPVVVGVDGSPASRQAVDLAFEEASWRRVDLVAVHVWSDLKVGEIDESPLDFDPRAFEEYEHSLLSECLAGYGERYPDVTVHRKVYVDGPRAHLQSWSEKAQLVVVGTRGRGGFKGMVLGSTGNALMREARCPVMVVRPVTS